MKYSKLRQGALVYGFLLALLLAGASAAAAAGSSQEFSSVEKSSEYVVMNDGTKIAVDIYLPSGYTGEGEAPESFPVIFSYLPYQRASMNSDGSIDDHSDNEFLPYGYAIVYADMRGTGASFGWMADFMRQICRDGKELVSWIDSQPWCDGNVGMSGGSYLGWSQLCVASQAPEALKCIVPAVVPLEGFTGEVYPGGIYLNAFMKLWSGGQYPSLRNLTGHQAAPVVDEDGDGMLADEIPVDINQDGTFIGDYQWPVNENNPPQYPDNAERSKHYYFNATMEHAAHPEGAPGNYDYDNWCRNIYFIDTQRPSDGLTATELCANLVPKIMDSGIPVYNVGGWFDGFARGTTELYATMKETNPSRLLMRPSYHGPVSKGFREMLGIDKTEYEKFLFEEQLKYYDHYLKGMETGIKEEDPVLIYVMNGEGWRREKEWPLSRAEKKGYYFGENNSLTKSEPSSSAQGWDEYPADFTHNSGFGELDVSWLAPIHAMLGKPAPVTDTFYFNRYLSVAGAAPSALPERTEQDKKCLTYTSEPLEDDKEVTGHPILHLWVSSTADYGDLYFYLEDVDKNGKAVLVTEYPLRAGFHEVKDNDLQITADNGVDVLPDLPWHGYREQDYEDSVFAGSRVVEIKHALQPTSWVFKEGHRIRVSIAAADWPTFRLHPELAPGNRPDDPDNIVPTITVYHSKERPSRVELPVVSAESDGHDSDDTCFINCLN